MRFWYPKSFFMLLVIGFAMVAGPLIIALLNNAVAVDSLAEQSRKAVYQAVQATQTSRALADQITGMERAGRQYLVVTDRALLETYEASHQRFKETAAEFARFPLSRDQRARLDAIIAKEDELYGQLARHADSPVNPEEVAEDFAALFSLAQSLIMLSNQLIDREVDALRQLATQAQGIVGLQLLALLPVALFIGIGFTILITRPIRQIESGIRSIGSGLLDADIVVNGPQDLENVGRQLNWLRQRLQELEEQKARFLRHVSHELKTPLTALREGSDLLAEEATGRLTEGQREIVRIMQDNSIKLRKMIEDLLNYSASNHRESLLEVKPVRMKEVISKVTADHKLPLIAKEIELTVACDDVTVRGDEEKLRIVVDNLLSNAVKFTPRGGWIKLRLNETKNSGELHVVDSGPGIAQVERQRVFDAFFQGSAESSGPVRGTGLGLSIVRELVTAHGGMVTIADGESTGAHFVVALPLMLDKAH
ncbi:MAG TPA: ATP-binding protein [Burkholderiales bacterium]|nr:ATP-binding protein [Burkholderiales bacterium]